MLQKTARTLSVLLQSLRSREQKKRVAEVSQKMKNSIETTLGKDRVKEMVELSTIGVYPELQGKGYGTQLAKVVSAVADAQGRECFLLSSNVKVNTVFYNNLGYETVDIFLLGEDNPKWDKEPVPVALMVRPSFQGRNKY
ncbi:hypothetical protein C8Q75DRAFT_215845 [Abortiporus biennis]|nr:hypothetical protein C8Q75DRAFT_215845 [Abortiporus biennis]